MATSWVKKELSKGHRQITGRWGSVNTPMTMLTEKQLTCIVQLVYIHLSSKPMRNTFPESNAVDCGLGYPFNLVGHQGTNGALQTDRHSV